MSLSDFSKIMSMTNKKNTYKIHLPIPRLLFIRVTEACNASCFMCKFAGNQTPHRLTIKKARRLTTELAVSTIRHIRLTGGEPLLLEEVGHIVSMFKDAGFVVSIVTNGMLINKRWPDLAAAELDQIVVSLDSSCSEMHDKLRNTEGLYQNAVVGIKRVRSKSLTTVIRVNTVVGKHNLESLPDMFSLLHELGVKQWSLIPLKPLPMRFPQYFENTWFSVREQLLDQMARLGEPRIMSNSLNLFGSNLESYGRIMAKGCPETPQPKCELVEWIRYLDLATQRVFPCNCVPHRGKQANQFGELLTRNSWRKTALESSRTWLRHNGPTQCTGCEPLNVALGEGRIDLNEDLFGF